MEPTSTSTQKSLFNSPHSALIRIWHWTFFLLLISTIVVVFFAKQVFDSRGNTSMVVEEAAQRGVELNEKQARGIAHGFSEKLWEIHIYIGYGITFLLLSRIVIEVVIGKEERMRSKLKKAFGFVPENDSAKKDRKHFLSVKVSYLIFYTLIFIMALTGLGLIYEDVPIFDTWHRPIKQVHEFVQYGIYAFIILHLTGVLWADLTNNNGLISGMIHGKKR